MLPLTKRQREAKDWIVKYIATHRGVSPTLAEIAEGLETELTGGAYLVKALVQRGHATRVPGLWRTLRLIPERRPRRQDNDNHVTETA